MEIYGTDEFKEWFDSLDEKDGDSVIRYVDMLELDGVTLGAPYSSAIKNADFALRELRVQSAGKPIRVFYAFDPARDAVLLIGGDKSGAGDKRFYETMTDISTKLWREYLEERGFNHGNRRGQYDEDSQME